MRRSFKILILFLLIFGTYPVSAGNRSQLDSLLNLLHKSNNDTNCVHVLQKLAIKYRNVGDLDSSIYFAQRAILLSDSLDFKVGFMNANQAMGNTLVMQGNLNGALRHFLTTLKTAELTNNITARSSACLNIGNVYYYLLQFDKALEYFKLSLKYKIELKQTKGLANIYNNIGETYRMLKKREEALEYLNKALNLFRESNNKRGMALALTNLGIISMSEKNFTDSEDKLKLAFSIYAESEDKEGLCGTNNQLGELYLAMGQYSKAEGYFNTALTMAKEIGLLHVIAESNENLSEICKKTGRDALALDYFKAFVKANDSIRNDEITKKTTIQEMEFKFEQQQAVLELEQAKKDAVVEAELRYQKNQRNYLFVGFALMILLAFFILWGYLQKRRSNIVLEDKNQTIERQKVTLEEKQKEIIDSINYARRIQYTLLAHEEYLRDNIKEHFIYFNPKDIVSGDFYWAAKQKNRFYLAVCDSTGHGVPGAFMSLLNIGFLTEAIIEKGIEEPNNVFDYVRMKLINTVSLEGQKDGFDGVLLCFDSGKNTLTYAAANSSPVLVQNGKVESLPCDRMPVGMGEKTDRFNLYNIDKSSGEMLYVYTDGYADQFGGEKGKKLMYKRLNEMLLTLHNLPLIEQGKIIKRTFEDWKGDLEQVDDVCVIGIRI